MRSTQLRYLTALILCCLSACQTSSARVRPEDSIEKPDWIVIETTQEGIYQIHSAQIRAAGLEVDEVNPESIQVWWKGEPIPFVVDQKNQAVLFYAYPPGSTYSASNFYWLVRTTDQERIRAQVKLPEAEPFDTTQAADPFILSLGESSGRTLRSIQLEENSLYTPQVESGDRWLWEAYSAPHTRSFLFDLPAADGGEGRLKVRSWARTEGPNSIDHHWQFWLNEQLVGDNQWDGKGVDQFTGLIPAGILKAGENQLEIRTLNDTGLRADIVFVDKIELEYLASAKPENDRLVFQAIEKSLPIQDFSGLVAGFRINASNGTITLLETTENGDSLITEPGDVYWLAGHDAIQSPHAIYPAWIEPNMAIPEEGVDYLAIGPKDLLAPLEPLLQFHQSGGLTTRTVPVESIYHHFNGSYPEPDAIRRFIQYTRQEWANPGRYVLLVGDSTYDPRGYLGTPPENLLPAFFVDTMFGGQTASDVLYSILDGDDLPDLAVGRVPARSVKQVQVFVEKTLTYAKTESNLDVTSILAVADGQEATFRTDAERFLQQFPEGIETHLLSPVAGTNDASRQVIDAIQQRHWLVSYFGHGSIDMWGKDRLLTTADIDQLNHPAATTIFVNMTCLTGLFTHPELESLAEALLFQAPGGAVAVLAPTSLTLPGDQSFLSQALVASLNASSPVIIGDVLLQARRNIPLNYPGSKDVLFTFLLFGDPALRVR